MDIYVINLAKREDRLRTIASHLADLGLAGIRVAAIDGAMLSEDPYAVVDKGADACWRSHQLVFALIAASAASNALVLEDDAVLTADRDWRALLGALDTYMTVASIDVLQLGFLEKAFPTRVQWLINKCWSAVRAALKRLYAMTFNEELAGEDSRWDCLGAAPEGMAMLPNSFAGGSHCYVISRRAASAFINFNRPVFLPADDFFGAIADMSAEYQSFKIARLKKSLAGQRGNSWEATTDSDIDPYSVDFITRRRKH